MTRPRIRFLAPTFAAVALCGGCGDEQSGPSSGSSPVIQQTPEEGHLWDTSDPNAAVGPLGLILIGMIVAGICLLFLVRRPTRSKPRSRPPRGRGR